tara:strand:- start:1104 stop:2957 length:1854 start_codon:yes stop_codon:yes gene_type:complete
MTSLTDLNAFADGTLTWTDSRTSDVIFNFPDATDITDTITTASFALKRNIEIVEIVKPAQALVTFKVDLSALTGAAATFAAMPAGCALTNPSSQVYLVSGITSVSDWNTIKEPIISIPGDSQGSFAFECQIAYVQNGAAKLQTWTVGNYKAIAELTAVSSISLTPEGMLRDNFAHPLVTCSAVVEATEAALGMVSSISCTIFHKHGIVLDLPVRAELTHGGTKVEGIRNLYYKSKVATRLVDNTVVITATSDYMLVSVDSGYVGTAGSNPGPGVTCVISGSVSAMEDQLELLQYYPPIGAFTTDVTISFTLRNGGASGTIVDQWQSIIVNNGTSTFPTATHTFTSNDTWYMTLEEYLYGTVDVIVVGGGGGGAWAGGGGGGGGVISATGVESIFKTIGLDTPSTPIAYINRQFPIYIAEAGPGMLQATAEANPTNLHQAGVGVSPIISRIKSSDATIDLWSTTNGAGGYFQVLTAWTGSSVTFNKPGGIAGSGASYSLPGSTPGGVAGTGLATFNNIQDNDVTVGGGGGGANGDGQDGIGGTPPGAGGSGVIAWDGITYGAGGCGNADDNNSPQSCANTGPVANTGYGGRSNKADLGDADGYDGSTGLVKIRVTHNG